VPVVALGVVYTRAAGAVPGLGGEHRLGHGRIVDGAADTGRQQVVNRAPQQGAGGLVRIGNRLILADAEHAVRQAVHHPAKVAAFEARQDFRTTAVGGCIRHLLRELLKSLDQPVPALGRGRPARH
jgi:hypothetical protein